MCKFFPTDHTDNAQYCKLLSHNNYNNIFLDHAAAYRRSSLSCQLPEDKRIYLLLPSKALNIHVIYIMIIMQPRLDFLERIWRSSEALLLAFCLVRCRAAQPLHCRSSATRHWLGLLPLIGNTARSGFSNARPLVQCNSHDLFVRDPVVSCNRHCWASLARQPWHLRW